MSNASSYLILHSEHAGDHSQPWIVYRCYHDSDRQDELFRAADHGRASAYLCEHWDDVVSGNFDAAREPLRAIRDLIVACEPVFGADAGEDEILRRAREGFASLRKLFGDVRPNEAVAIEHPVEPESFRKAMQFYLFAIPLALIAGAPIAIASFRVWGI